MDKKRKIIALILIIFILISGTYIFINKDIIFLNKVIITYPDGCIEKFENGEIITPECIEGRMLMEQQNKQVYIADEDTSDENKIDMSKWSIPKE